MEKGTYDFTTIDVFQTCRKKMEFWGIRHLMPKTKSPALRFGGAIHEALDVYYDGKPLDNVLQKFKESYNEVEGEELRTVENGIKLLTWYSTIYKDDVVKILLRPESAFAFDLGDFLYAGKIDLVVEWGGEMWIMEHKTTTRLGASYADQFQLDKQITGYIVAAEQHMKRECAGCILNVLEPWNDVQRVSSRTKAPEQHFMRFPITRSKELKERFLLNISRIVRDIEWCRSNNEWMEAEKKEVCTYYNRKCQYFDICRFGENEQLIKNDYMVEEWNPLKRKVVENGDV